MTEENTNLPPEAGQETTTGVTAIAEPQQDKEALDTALDETMEATDQSEAEKKNGKSEKPKNASKDDKKKPVVKGTIKPMKPLKQTELLESKPNGK